MPAELTAWPAVRFHAFMTSTRQISLRNTGVNTLWMSFNRTCWFDVACGTSWDDRVNVQGFWYCTQVGVTSFVVNGLALNTVDLVIPEPLPAEVG